MVFGNALNLESPVRRERKGVVHQLEVIDAPDSLIAEGTVAGLEHRDIWRIEIRRGYILKALFAVKIDRHRLVGRVVVHISHNHDFNPGIELLHSAGVVVDDFGAAASEVSALSTHAGREMGDIEGELLARNLAVHHQDVTGLEVGGVGVGEVDVRVEVERDGLAVKKRELLGLVEQRHVHSPSVGAVVVDNLVVRLGDLRLAHKVLEDKAVLNLGNAQNRVPAMVVVGHSADYRRHIVELLVVLGLGPVVFALRSVFLVIFHRVVIDVEKVLEVVESDDIVLTGLLRPGGKAHKKQQKERD